MAEPRFKAFLSYSHKDARHARWLHRRLEGYRLPRRLIGTDGERGPVPARIAPIFRDREELPAAGDLSEKVRGALAQSESLVILCSPHSAGSPWVAKEIATFRALHPDHPILAVIVEGEPAQCFPSGLADGGVEPLAADLRPEGDGRRLGFLKLVAGLAGVDLDALVQRDAQRRLRRVTAVTLGALTGMLAMTVLAIFAFTARAEAERQRAEAEGLVEFMLTDLRDRLKGVNRLAVLTSVNQRALAYYQGQDLEGLSKDSLERRARILHAMGEDDEKRGNLDRALAQFEEAARTTAALVADKPDDPDRIFAHSQSEYWVGLIAWRHNRFDAAQAAFERYQHLAGRLVAIDGSNPDWLMEAGYAASNLATLLLRTRGDAAGAEERFRASLAQFKAAAKLKPADPGILWDIADAHAWIADSCRWQKKYAEALAQRQRQAAILARLLRDDPEDARYARGGLTNALGLAQIELELGRNREAEARLRSAYARAAELAGQDPENEELEKQRVATRLFLAKAMLRNGTSDRPRVAALLAPDCASRVSRADEELVRFCDILVGRSSNLRTRTEVRLATPRLSPRWGIDFASERNHFN